MVHTNDDDDDNNDDNDNDNDDNNNNKDNKRTYLFVVFACRIHLTCSLKTFFKN